MPEDFIGLGRFLRHGAGAVLAISLSSGSLSAWDAAEAELPRKLDRPATRDQSPLTALTVPSKEAEKADAAQNSIPKARVAVKPAAPAEFPKLIEALGSRESNVRDEAMSRLTATGLPVVDLLKEAGRSRSLEIRVRAVKILREIYVAGDDATVDAVEAALDELVADKNASVSARAENVLARHYDIREKRALSEIQRLGGIITYQEDPFIDPVTGEASESRMISHIILGKDWKAGDEGLKHIRRLSRLRMVYYIPESGVSEAALKELQIGIPNLIVQRRGRACLGVAGVTDPAGRGCQVMRVIEGSAAARARFQVGDVVMSFNGKEVADFDKLIELIGTTKPGDKVKVEVLRDFQKTTLEPVMDEWKQ